VVFASTCQIYGKSDYLPVDEEDLLRPVDVNGINKMAGEWYHILYNDVFGIHGCSLRLTNTYGPRMRVRDARQRFPGVWLRLIVEGHPFEVWEGRQLPDFTYVDDAVEAMMLAALDKDSAVRVFNVGGDSVISLLDLARLLVELNGGGEFEQKFFPEDRKHIDIGDYYADDKLIRSVLGWAPRVALRDGLVAYYREHLSLYV